MNRLEKRFLDRLNYVQKKQILINYIVDYATNTEEEKLDLITKLNLMDKEEIENTFNKVILKFEKEED